MNVLAAIMFAAMAGATGPVDAWWNPPGPTDFTGNGRLTVSQTPEGVIQTCRWPSPGGPDHLGQHRSPQGLQWGLLEADTIRWSGAAAAGAASWTTDDLDAPGLLASRCVDTASGLTWRHEAVVLPAEDVLAVRIRVEGAPPLARLVWQADFSPSPSGLVSVPGLDTAWDTLTDCAVRIEENGTVVHFRPRAHGHAPKEALEAARQGRTGEGIYIAIRVLGGEAQAACRTWQRAAGGASAWRRPEDAMQAAGQVFSRFTFAPGIRDAVVAAAFGETWDAALDKLAGLSGQTWPDLRSEAAGHWREETAPLLDRVQPAVRPMLAHAALRLLWSTDASGGAPVRSQAPVPGEGLVWMEDAYWAVRALDAVGLYEESGRLCRFMAEARRTTSWPGIAAGSVPPALRYNGREALPPHLSSLPAACYVAQALGAHAAALPAFTDPHFVKSMEPAARDLAAYLDAWRNPHTGQPASSFDFGMLRDAVRFEDAHRLKKAQAALTGLGVPPKNFAAGEAVAAPGDILYERRLYGAVPRAAWAPFPPDDPIWGEATQAALTEPLGQKAAWAVLTDALLAAQQAGMVPGAAAELARKLFAASPPGGTVGVATHAQILLCCMLAPQLG